MALARNKKPDASAIAAFGAAAEARPADTAPPAPAKATKIIKPEPAKAGEEQRPKSSLVRWTDEDLRDRIIDYSKRERYSLQHLMIEAMKIGIDQIEKR